MRLAAIFWLLASSLFGAYKGSTYFVDSAGLGTITTSGTLSIATGDLIVVVVGGSDTVSGVTCGSNTLTRVRQETASSYTSEMWYMQNSVSGTTSCTATYATTGSNYRAIMAANYDGVATTSALDQSSCNSATCNALAATATTITAQNVTTTVANTILIACVNTWDGTTLTAANGYTLRAQSTTQAILDKTVSATGTYPSGNFATNTPTDQYYSFFAAFALTGGSPASYRQRRVVAME